MNCPNCGAEIPSNANACEFCGSPITITMKKEQEQLNKAGCPKCGSSNIAFTREKQGEIRNKKGTAVVRSTIGLCKDCGYTWNSSNNQLTNKKKSVWIWVLGWIFVFPLPLTILLRRKTGMSPIFKYIVIAIAWLAYIAILVTGNASNNSTKTISQLITYFIA